MDCLPQTTEGRLWRLAEECAEVIQAASKFRRFGPKTRDPVTGREYDNVQDLLAEIADLEHAIGEVRANVCGPTVEVLA